MENVSTAPHNETSSGSFTSNASNAQAKASTGLLSGFLPGVVAAGEQRAVPEQSSLVTSKSNFDPGSDTTGLSSQMPTYAVDGNSKSYESMQEFRSLPVKSEGQPYLVGGTQATKRGWTSTFINTDDADDEHNAIDDKTLDTVSLGRNYRPDYVPKLRSGGPSVRVDDDSMSSKLLPGDVPQLVSSSRSSVVVSSSSPPPGSTNISDHADFSQASETTTSADIDEDEFGIQQNELEMAMSDVPSDSMPEEKMKLSLLLANLSEDQLERYEIFRRSCFARNNVKRIMQTVTGMAVTQNVVIAMCGMAKVFVGEIVEEALDVQTQWKEEGGALEPKHIREAVRRAKVDLS